MKDKGIVNHKEFKEYPYLTLKEVKEGFLDEINTSNHREKIDLDHALNRVTFSHIHSKNPVPSSNRISHDGIIVRGEDFSGGLPDTSNWEPVKDYIKASMGSCLPENFDTLIRDEDVKFSADGALEINKIPKQGQGISLKGSNITKSEKIVSKLTTLNPRHLSILRMAGVEEIDVIRKPKVAIIPTGSKISEKADDSKPGYTVDSNSILIKSYLEEWGADPTIYPIVKGSIKDLEAIINNIIKEFEEKYSVKDKQDGLAMCALQYVAKSMTLENSISEKEELLTEEINKLTEQINQSL